MHEKKNRGENLAPVFDQGLVFRASLIVTPIEKFPQPFEQYNISNDFKHITSIQRRAVLPGAQPATGNLLSIVLTISIRAM